MEGPDGTTEISRWRKPPESAPRTSEPRMGRLNILEVNRLFQSPLRGSAAFLGWYRWLTPPANIKRPSGPRLATFAEVSTCCPGGEAKRSHRKPPGWWAQCFRWLPVRPRFALPHPDNELSGPRRCRAFSDCSCHRARRRACAGYQLSSTTARPRSETNSRRASRTHS